MLPKWLQPIENAFRWAEKKTTTKVFLILVALTFAAGGFLTWIILKNRVEAGWLKDTREFDMSVVPRAKYCDKEIRWARTDLPVPVYLDSALPEDWEPAIKEGLELADPWKKLFALRGRLQPGEDGPKGAVTIEQHNADDHGLMRWEVIDAGTYCKMVRATIKLPVLMLPGKGRTRAAAHELLHAMGLSHSDWETHLMYPKASTLFPFEMSPKERELLESAYVR